MKILLAVDGSKYSEAAVEAVAQHPWPASTQIKVIMALELPVATGGPMMQGAELWALPPNYYDEVENAMRGAAESTIQKVVQTLKAHDQNLQITSEIVRGSPRRIVIEEAESWNADLIAIGSRGLGAWSRFLLGSVSQAVATHAPCSVLIVRRFDANDAK